MNVRCDGPPRVHFAQFNIATLRHPVGHPATKSFEDLIDETNARAEASDGFVWRHGIDTRTDEPVYDNPLISVNASVWESPTDLRNYVYQGFHRDVFKRRKDWFTDSASVMWWIPAGTTPSMEECTARLAFLRGHGSTPYGFAMGERHPQLVVAVEATDDDVNDTDTCVVVWVEEREMARADRERQWLAPDAPAYLEDALSDALGWARLHC